MIRICLHVNSYKQTMEACYYTDCNNKDIMNCSCYTYNENSRKYINCNNKMCKDHSFSCQYCSTRSPSCLDCKITTEIDICIGCKRYTRNCKQCNKFTFYPSFYTSDKKTCHICKGVYCDEHKDMKQCEVCYKYICKPCYNENIPMITRKWYQYVCDICTGKKQLKEHIKQLEEENKQLKLELEFRPGGSGAKEAEKHFKELSILRNINN